MNHGTPLDVWVSREKSRPFLGVTLNPMLSLMLLDQKGKVNDRRRTAPGAQARCWRPE